MVVKDEIRRLAGCLEPLLDYLDDIVIIDTGSSDGTPEMLEQRFGISPLRGQLQASRCLCKSDLRNHAYAQSKADWILSIDADERVAPAAMQAVREAIRDKAPAGYFGAWINHLEGEADFEDYKLFLFRKGLNKRGLVHENVQVDLREKGLAAAWLPGFEVHHHPEAAKHEAKTRLYRQRLECALAQQPDWQRYHWFLGYMNFQAGELDRAGRHFDTVIAAQPERFPVECLNSYMLRTEMVAREGKAAEVEALLNAALAFYRLVANDFEVVINFRLYPWLEAARDLARAGCLEGIRAYRFAR
jgi:glycosyltransferase involved in cell wall biosynthesis